MKKNPIRVLCIEDRPADADHIVAALEKSGMRAQCRRVTTKAAFTTALNDFLPDVIFSDHDADQLSVPVALDVVRALTPATPFIVVSRALSERAIVSYIRCGAEDVVLKSDLGRLPAAIDAAMVPRRQLRLLSPRQIQVFRLISHGCTTREIAHRLRVSVKTAETHRTEVMKRLGLHDVAGVVRYAVRVGIVLSSQGPPKGGARGPRSSPQVIT